MKNAGRTVVSKVGPWVFPAAVLVLYGVVAMFDAATASRGFMSFVALFWKVLPVLALVFVLLWAFNTFAEPKWLARLVGRESGLLGWVVALFGGALSLGPVYPWYPLLGELEKKGVRRSLIATFLYARAVKPPMLPLLIHYFGLPFSLILTGYLLAFAVIGGLLTARFSVGAMR